LPKQTMTPEKYQFLQAVAVFSSLNASPLTVLLIATTAEPLKNVRSL
jgi:hypothetical protein